MSFAKAFMGILDEVKDKRNRAIFELLDARSEGELSIVYLMQLMHNLP